MIYEELLTQTEDEIHPMAFTIKVIKQENSDRFNSRIIFPINNISGETIAFGGRIINDSKLCLQESAHKFSMRLSFKRKPRYFNLDKAKNLTSQN